jgi:hypothetical protein
LVATINEYYGSPAFRSLTGGTPTKRRAILEHFREKHGHMPLASLPKEFVIALLDTMKPTVASNWLTALRHFFQWCEQRKLLRTDPTWGIRFKLPKSGGHHTWTEDEIAAFEAGAAEIRRGAHRPPAHPRRRTHGAAAKDQAHHRSHARYSDASRLQKIIAATPRTTPLAPRRGWRLHSASSRPALSLAAQNRGCVAAGS